MIKYGEKVKMSVDINLFFNSPYPIWKDVHDILVKQKE